MSQVNASEQAKRFKLLLDHARAVVASDDTPVVPERANVGYTEMVKLAVIVNWLDQVIATETERDDPA